LHITITGYPLPAPVRVQAEPDEHIFGDGWLLTQRHAQTLVAAWADAPTDPAPDGTDDVRRAWDYCELGLFITALHLDGELGISHWESVTGSEGTDLYSTTMMPFDFTIHPDTPPDPTCDGYQARR
jgi:hypothetical protein